MKVLVTGASGVVGSHLAEKLNESGFLVRALMDPADESPSLSDIDIEPANGDLLDPESLPGPLKGVQAVFHCESSSSYWPPRSPEVIALNTTGTRNLLVAMAKSGVERLVHVGSAFSFGAGTEEEPGTEKTPFDGGRFKLACIDSMKAAQDFVLRYNESGKVLCMVINPTLVVGSAPGAVTPFSILAGYLVSGNSSYPSGGVNVVGAADVATAVLKALGRGKSGSCYIIGGENLSYKELFERMAPALGVPPPKNPESDSRFILRGSAGSLRGKLLRGTPPLSRELARLGTATLYYSHEKAARELDFSPSPIGPEIEGFCRQFGAANLKCQKS
jgi:dihydroflavonol-4-reductase